MTAPESRSTRATVSSIPMLSARSLSQESVIGIGQNTPFASAMSAALPRQSADPMKPVSGVYAPIASIRKSEVSRLHIGTAFSVLARFISSARSASGTRSGIKTSLPCGGTNFDMVQASFVASRRRPAGDRGA